MEKAERAVAAALVLFGREKVLVREMAALTGIGESACSRLLRSPVASANGASDNPCQAPTPGEGSRVDAAR